MLLQCQTFLSFISGESLQTWEIFLLLIEETSVMIKMQQYIDQNHLSKWKNATPCHYVKHRAVQDFCTILRFNRIGHKKRPCHLDYVAVPTASPAPDTGNAASLCAGEEGADKSHRGAWTRAAPALTYGINLCGCQAQETSGITRTDPQPLLLRSPATAPHSQRWCFLALVLNESLFLTPNFYTGIYSSSPEFKHMYWKPET